MSPLAAVRRALHTWFVRLMEIQPIDRLDAPAPRSLNEECAIHGHEPIPPGGAYLICGECWHAYLTPQELVDEHNRMLKELADAPAPWNNCGTVRATNVRIQALDEKGNPVGPPIPMPDAAVEINYTPFPIDLYKIKYEPLTADQVTLVRICPHCTHDF